MKYTLVLLIGIALFSCKQNERITNPEDYNAYLEESTDSIVQKTQNETEFWNKRIKVDSSQIIELNKSAAAYARIFQTEADILYLKKAEQNILKAVEKAAIAKDGYLRALAQNYITQHRFKEAMAAVDSAEATGGEKKATNFLKYDVAMELGQYEKAKQVLDQEADFSDFNYLIRLAKYQDYNGNLDATIQHMENAQVIAEKSNQDGLKMWTYTNLGDYYGHAGRIIESYQSYLRALAIEPSNAYAKKGIAWIVYSYENDPEEALRIIASIEKSSKSPDYDLLKAEIYESMGDEEKSKELTDSFLKKVSNPLYGDMYGAYLVDIYASRNEADKAIKIAEKEVANRPTPASYDLLAHAYLANGDAQKALKIAEEKVIGKTYEPKATYHTALIYKELNMIEELSPLKEELLDTAYEMGPVTYSSIKSL